MSVGRQRNELQNNLLLHLSLSVHQPWTLKKLGWRISYVTAILRASSWSKSEIAQLYIISISFITTVRQQRLVKCCSFMTSSQCAATPEEWLIICNRFGSFESRVKTKPKCAVPNPLLSKLWVIPSRPATTSYLLRCPWRLGKNGCSVAQVRFLSSSNLIKTHGL